MKKAIDISVWYDVTDMISSMEDKPRQIIIYDNGEEAI
jgi:hypothetical protein